MQSQTRRWLVVLLVNVAVGSGAYACSSLMQGKGTTEVNATTACISAG